MTKEYINHHFEYHKSGNLIIKNKRYQCDVVGSLLKNRPHHSGYVYIEHNRKSIALHAVIFILHYGYRPKFIDHINRNKSDNRIENLRPATRSQNNFNIKKRKNNKSGFRGVSLCKESGKWKAQISINNKKINLGRFKFKKDAYAAFVKSAKENYGKFFN